MRKTLSPAQQRRQQKRNKHGEYDPYEHVRPTFTLDDEGMMVPLSQSEPKKVTYSFVEGQKKLQEDFEKHFGDIPTRFFTTDFGETYKWKVGNNFYDNTAYHYYNGSAQALIEAMPDLLDKSDEEIRLWAQTNGVLGNSGERMTISKIARSVTSKEDEVRDIDEIVEHTHGVKNLHCGDMMDEGVLLVDVPCWRHRPDLNSECKDCTQHTIDVTTRNRPSKPIGYYRYRTHPNSSLVSRRELAGLARLGVMTDNPYILGDYLRLNNRNLPEDERTYFSEKWQKIKTLDDNERQRLFLEKALSEGKQTAFFHQAVTEKVLDKQAEGANFHAQKKYWDSIARGTIARSFEEKKNPDKAHSEWARTSPMSRYFSAVEADNDTDMGQVRDFENEVMRVMERLPKPRDGAAPALRVRKLGKHSSSSWTTTGLYAPAHNTIVVSEKDSGSFIHEYGHYVDHVVASNGSLSGEFRGVVEEYKNRLPAEVDRREYYGTPTEVYARAFEIWAHEKQGISSSRVLHEEKYRKAPEYAPLLEPELKEKFFTLFDQLME